MSAVQRRYVEVAGRRVCYRQAGVGPPLVMFHGSPGSSAMLAEEMAATAPYFSCFAFDAPGFGGSDPLPGETLTVYDLADATAEAMRAVGLPPCVAYGTHTGALIAIELAVAHPDQVTGLVMEGLPAFTEAEMAALFADYFTKMVPDPLGGHLISTWVRFRDQFIWFPWTARDVRRLNPVDRPTPEEIHLWVMMFYQSCGSYIPAYRAACHHGHLAIVAAEALTQPAVYMASAEDMLFPHLDRLPALKDGQRIERLAYDPGAKHAAIVAFARELPQGSREPIAPVRKPAGRDPAVQFVDAPHGQVLVRCYGDPAAPPIVLLHDAPGSGLALAGIARTLAKTHYVALPDLPGNGESDDPPVADGDDFLAACAQGMIAIIAAFGFTQVTIAAVGCGCAVAALLAREPQIADIVMENPPHADPAIAARIAPDLAMTPEGSHWIKAWLMVRDGQIYDPWFAGTIASQRRSQGNFDADWLHAQTCEIMKARSSYHRLPRAAWAFDVAAALAEATVPVRHAPILDLALSGAL